MKPICIAFFLFISFLSFSQTIQNVQFHGLKKTNETLLFKHLKQVAGTTYDSVQVQCDRQNLYNLGYFVRVTDSLETINQTVILHYTCEEVISLLPILLAGSVGDNSFIKVGIQNLNLWGRGGVLKIAYQYQNGHSYFFNTTIPYVLKSNFGIGIDAKQFTSIEPVFIANKREAYDFENESIQVMGFYEFKLFHRLYFKGLYQHEVYSKMESNESPLFPEKMENNGFGWRLLHEYANTNFFGSIVEGFKFTNYIQTLYLENTTTPFYQFVSESAYYKRISTSGDLALRFKFGLTSNHLGYFSPFTLDSYLNIRGVGNIVDRGTGQIVLNMEYRHIVKHTNFGCWQLVGFIDSGTWRHPYGDYTDFLNHQNLKVFQGFGGRVFIKKLSDLVIRVDFGYDIGNIRNNGFVFGFGQYF